MHPAPQASPPAQCIAAQPRPTGSSKPTRLPAQSSAQREVWMSAPMQPIPEEHVPAPGQRVSGNLWNMAFRETDTKRHGPQGSLLRHATSMPSPNIPNYVYTPKLPVKNPSNLRQEPTMKKSLFTSPTWPTSSTDAYAATTCSTHAYGATTCPTDADADNTSECYVASETGSITPTSSSTIEHTTSQSALPSSSRCRSVGTDILQLEAALIARTQLLN